MPTSTPAVPDSVPASPKKVEDTLDSLPTKPIASQTAAVIHQQLFAQYFRPPVNNLEPNTRDTSRISNVHPFFLYYNEARFEAAIRAYPVNKSDKKWQYYLANAYLATGKFNNATAILENLLQDENFNYADQLKWYLVLAYLHQSKIRSAQKLLTEIHASYPVDSMGIKAKDLLNKIKE